MKTTQYTPGPWSIQNSANTPIVVNQFGNTICVPENRIDEERHANAALIATAPELLELSQKLDNAAMRFADDHKYYYDKGDQDQIDSMLADLHNAHLALREAIKKATLVDIIK